MLVGIVTMMLIAVGAALPLWRAVEQREKEAELVARGFQYAEAIRVFQHRQGRLPIKLDELLEVEPRSLRKLWKDPMTGGAFALLVEGPDGTVVAVDAETGQLIAPPEPAGEGEEQGEGPAAKPPPGAMVGTAAPPIAGAPIAGPIHGVKSRARGEAYRTLFDQKDFGDWEFTVERLVAATTATTPDGILRRLDYATIGRAFRDPPPGGVPGSNPQPLGGQQNQQHQPGAPPPGQQPHQQPHQQQRPPRTDQGDSGSGNP